MEQPSDGPPPPAAAPRHLRRRRLREDIPDPLLVPGTPPLRAETERSAPTKRAAVQNPDRDEVAYHRKRMVALVAVVIVALSVPLLIAALVLLG